MRSQFSSVTQIFSNFKFMYETPGTTFAKHLCCRDETFRMHCLKETHGPIVPTTNTGAVEKIHVEVNLFSLPFTQCFVKRNHIHFPVPTCNCINSKIIHSRFSSSRINRGTIILYYNIWSNI